MIRSIIRISLLVISQIVYSYIIYAQPPHVIYDKNFKWTIAIPFGFEEVGAEEIEATQDYFEDVVEYRSGQRMKTFPIFTFRSDAVHYMEANYQLTESSYEDYIDKYRSGYDIIYKMFASEIPNAVIDTIQSATVIDSLEFQMFKIKVSMEDIYINTLAYTRLFGKRYFTLSIVYADEMKGKAMIEAWHASKFLKTPEINIPATGVYIVPPDSFQLAVDTNILRRDSLTSIGATEFTDMEYESGLFLLNLLCRSDTAWNTVLYEEKTTTVAGYPATYFKINTEPDNNRYLMVFGDSTFSVLMAGIYPVGDEETGNMIRDAMLSVRHEKGMVKPKRIISKMKK